MRSIDDVAPYCLTWRKTLLMISLVFAARVIYLVWFCPYELLGDEAYYWEWSRHLDLCYYEKGPGLAYFIAVFTRLFGASEWAVRMPVAVSSFVAACILARLANSASRGNERVGFFASLLFVILPPFVANAQICTQDGPLIAIWLGLTAIGLRLFRNLHSVGSRIGDWMSLGALLGLGFLFKQSVLLFAPSVFIYAILMRRTIRWERKIVWHCMCASLVFIVLISPMLYWNALHGWPTFEHTVGHLAGAGDQSEYTHHGWTIQWFLSLAGAQIGIFGPAFILMCALATVRAVRLRNTKRFDSHAQLWLLSAALPSIAFFLMQSLFKSVIASWPFPSVGPLLVLVAQVTEYELTCRTHLDEPSKVTLIRRHRRSTLFTRAWDCSLCYCLVGSILVLFPEPLRHLPILGDKLDRQFSRFEGHRDEAVEMASYIHQRTGGSTIIVSGYYMRAALYAFYMPGQPTVYNAGTEAGKRKTAYDYWPDTNLNDPRLHGRTVFIEGEGNLPWARLLNVDSLQLIDNGEFMYGTNYQGARANMLQELSD